MSEPTAGPPRRRGRRILESLPASSEVREEFRQTSRQLRLLLELLGLCEKAEGDRPRSRSKSAKA
jgi:c-di-GMP-related signal transduction protein